MRLDVQQVVAAGLGLLTILAAGLAEGAGPVAQDAPPPQDGVTFSSVLDLNQESGALKAMLRGGRLADSKTWPASFYVTYAAGSQTFACTAALVGPQALLTAAHCVPDSGAIKIAFGGAIPYDAVCERHPGYASKADRSADFALCHLTIPFLEPAEFQFETIDPQPVSGWLGRKILLSGYGCTSDSVAISQAQIAKQAAAVSAAAGTRTPPPVPDYRIGFATVAETSASPPKADRAEFYAPVEFFNIITAPDGANLCPGDSGGPAFVLSETSGASFQHRALVAVNSRVLFTDPDMQDRYGASLLAAAGAPGSPNDAARLSFRRWATAWAEGWKTVICGVPDVLGIPQHCRVT